MIGLGYEVTMQEKWVISDLDKRNKTCLLQCTLTSNAVWHLQNEAFLLLQIVTIFLTKRKHNHHPGKKIAADLLQFYPSNLKSLWINFFSFLNRVKKN